MSRLRAVFLVIFVVLSCFCIVPTHSANVLCMFTSSGKTQLIVFMAVANTLIERGHNVTVVTTIKIPPQSGPVLPFRHILLEPSVETAKKINDNLVEIAEEQTTKFQAMINLFDLIDMFTGIQRDALLQDQFQEFLREDNHFDLMLLGYYHNDYLVGVAARYRCPIAVVALGSPYGPISRMIGNPEETTYVQFPLFGKSQPLTFLQRLANFLWAAVEPLIQLYAHQKMENVYKRLFTADFYPTFSDVITNISLVLCNSHFSELPVRPLVPALVEIGGIQFKEEPDPLPEDIQAFLDSSTNGTILFNVGCKARGTYLRPDKVKAVVTVLSKLNQSVLWEWDENLPAPKAPNILFRQWLPQEGILAHKNTLIFVTDGRPNCIYGAQYRGVPMVGMPLNADEPFNVEEMTNKGFGVCVDVNTLTEDSFQQALDKVLNTPIYSAKVKRFSKIYRDRPTTARETAAFWLEYVIRHQGAPHMQSPLVKMTFIQSWNIDVIFVIATVLYAFLKLSKLIGIIVSTVLQLRANRQIWFRKYKCS